MSLCFYKPHYRQILKYVYTSLSLSEQEYTDVGHSPTQRAL